MPIYKPKLTWSEQANYFRVAQELIAAGVKVDIPDEWHQNACPLRILIGGPPASSIYQLSGRLVLYVVRVNLSAERGGLIIRDFDITPRWDRDVFPCYTEEGTA